jgi:hypothetical protein
MLSKSSRSIRNALLMLLSTINISPPATNDNNLHRTLSVEEKVDVWHLT